MIPNFIHLSTVLCHLFHLCNHHYEANRGNAGVGDHDLTSQSTAITNKFADEPMIGYNHGWTTTMSPMRTREVITSSSPDMAKYGNQIPAISTLIFQLVGNGHQKER